MKISQPTEKPVAASNTVTAPNAKSAPAVSARAPSAANMARSAGVAVTMSAMARTLEANNAGELPSVDLKKVERMRASIAERSYVINPGVIADKLLANAQEMLQRQKI